jgi:hypothetical protein
VVQPENLDPAVVRPKERKLIELCREEKARGRQVWVYVQFNNAYAVQERLAELLE